MRRRLRENIQIGDEVFVPRDEYYVTVLDIVDDMALVDGPMGKEYHNLNDLEKDTSGYDEPYLNESRKKVVRLTERDLTKLVRRIIKGI